MADISRWGNGHGAGWRLILSRRECEYLVALLPPPLELDASPHHHVCGQDCGPTVELGHLHRRILAVLEGTG